MSFDDLFILVVLIVIVVAVISFMRRQKSSTGSESTTTSTPSGQVGDTLTLTESQAGKMREDIRYIQTSTVADQVSILDELRETSPDYRQYCELVGTTMPKSGVIAPYSKREVAFYNVRCYRVENVNGREIETLVAHESSVDPFYFTDASSETPVYIDIATFGANCLLVNSCNHIEGPGSDFTKALKANIKSSGGMGTATAAVARAMEPLHNLTLVPSRVIRNLLGWIYLPQPAYALAGAGACGTWQMPVPSDDAPLSRRIMQAHGKGGGHLGNIGGFGSGNLGHGSGFGGGFGGPSGGFPLDGFPGGFGEFLGNATPSHNYGHSSNNSGAGDILLGIGLSALLNSLSSAAQHASQANTGGPQHQQPQKDQSFRGYRLVEDVVPLNYQVYCIGEIYRNGTQVHMGRSLSKEHTTYFFATKPEAELLFDLEG